MSSVPRPADGDLATRPYREARMTDAPLSRTAPGGTAMTYRQAKAVTESIIFGGGDGGPRYG